MEPVNENEGSVPVTPEQMEELGLERDYTEERNDRVRPFLTDILSAMGSHEFVFAAGSKDDLKKIEAKIDQLNRRAPTDTISDEDKEKVKKYTEELNNLRSRIHREIIDEEKSFDSFYEDKFIIPAMDRGLQVNDLNYTFGLLNSVIEIVSNISSTPSDGEELRIKPVALELLEKLSEVPDLMVIVDQYEAPEKALDRKKVYEDFYKDVVVPVFQKYNVQYNEVGQVFGLMKTLVFQIKNRTDRTINGAKAIAEAKLWGLRDRDELTIEMLHKKCIEKKPE